jgi:hypothetical protein
MRQAFSGYYSPTQDEYVRLWNEALIILDTNVILNLYRLPATAREELLVVLEKFKERLWIPFHVALEFQRRRLTVISSERKTTEDVLGAASDLVAELTQKVSSLEIDKHGLGLESKPLLEDLEQANSKLIEAIKAVHQAQLDIASSDPIRERLDVIFAGRIGPGPANQSELDAIVADGERRYGEKIPPGWADANKEKNPSEATFFAGGIKYQRKFGDLIIWRQLLSYTKSAEKRVVLLITADRKEDWWWREQGKTIGPQPELIGEARQLGLVDLFWMYSSDQFLEHAKRYAAANVSDATVSEVRDVIKSTSNTDRAALSFERGNESRNLAFIYQASENAVFDWLRSKFNKVDYNRGFPDFIAWDDILKHGYEVKVIRNLERSFIAPAFGEVLGRGYVAVNEGRLSDFTLVLVMTSADWSVEPDDWFESRLGRHIQRQLERFPVAGAVVGKVTPDGLFKPILHLRGERAIDDRKYEDA